MNPPAALLDANVLYPITLTDLLLVLAETGVFRPLWSDAIQDEWGRNLLADRPDIRPEQVARRRGAMDREFPSACVRGYEPHIPALVLPDPDDRHVLAAAIHGQAGALVTYNLADFPADTLARYGIVPVHPDDFLADVLSRQPATEAVVRAWVGDLADPAGRAVPKLKALAKLRLPRTAELVAELVGVARP